MCSAENLNYIFLLIVKFYIHFCHTLHLSISCDKRMTTVQQMLQLTAGFHQHGHTSGSRRGKTTDRENERRSAEKVTESGLGLQDSISEISLQAHDTSATKDISRFPALKITCLCVNIRFTAFKVSRARQYHRRGGKAGGGGAGSAIRTGGQTGGRSAPECCRRVGCWRGADPRWTCSKIWPCPRSHPPHSPALQNPTWAAHTERTDERTQRRHEVGGGLGQQGSTGESQGVRGRGRLPQKTVIKLHDPFRRAPSGDTFSLAQKKKKKRNRQTKRRSTSCTFLDAQAVFLLQALQDTTC